MKKQQKTRFYHWMNLFVIFPCLVIASPARGAAIQEAVFSGLPTSLGFEVAMLLSRNLD